MRIFAILAVLAALVVAVNATPSILYTRSQPPAQWTMLGRAKPTETVQFSIALTQRNLAELESIFWKVSDPTHADYQNFMTIDEINALVAPSKKHHDRVVSWLVKGGVHAVNIKSFKDMLDVKTTVKVAEKLFSTFMHYYRHNTEGTNIVRQYGAYSVPSHIRPLIHMVTGLSTFPVPHLKIHQSGPSNDNVGIVAQSLYSFYQIRSQSPGSHSETSVGVIEFQGQNYSPSDVTAYGQQVGITTQAVSAAHTVGPNDPTSPQTEAQLDIEMTSTVNQEATQWFWLESGNGWLYQFATHFFSTTDVPQVNSISYGWWEGDQCTIAPTECQQLGVDSTGYVSRVNAEFQKIAVRGITLISASGDSGANGRTDPDCSIPQLRAPYPASSPYITAVGATQVNNPVFNLPSQPAACTAAGLQCPSGGDEVAVSYAVAGFASGGGFSNYAATPSYQQAAVTAYLNSGVALPPASYFNATGRGFPDVAAIGHNNIIEQSGQIMPVGGTSASAPIVAAIVTLLNEAQVAKTGKPLGFLNPFLYQAYAANPANFHDITVGDNKCTEDGCASTCQGFLATKGWDPVTGLGSLNYANLLSYIQSS